MDVLKHVARPVAHHGEIVEVRIVDVCIDIIAVKPDVVHHPLNQKSSVASTRFGTSEGTLLMKIKTDIKTDMLMNMSNAHSVCTTIKLQEAITDKIQM